MFEIDHLGCNCHDLAEFASVLTAHCNWSEPSAVRVISHNDSCWICASASDTLQWHFKEVQHAEICMSVFKLIYLDFSLIITKIPAPLLLSYQSDLVVALRIAKMGYPVESFYLKPTEPRIFFWRSIFTLFSSPTPFAVVQAGGAKVTIYLECCVSAVMTLWVSVFVFPRDKL